MLPNDSRLLNSLSQRWPEAIGRQPLAHGLLEHRELYKRRHKIPQVPSCPRCVVERTLTLLLPTVILSSGLTRRQVIKNRHVQG
ncbi:hypothetical protein VTH06DRAFT_6756 [Thermothelomyces fergusii]